MHGITWDDKTPFPQVLEVTLVHGRPETAMAFRFVSTEKEAQNLADILNAGVWPKTTTFFVGRAETHEGRQQVEADEPKMVEAANA